LEAEGLRRISIFGATGSVGEQTVDLIRRAGGAETHQLVALTGGRNVARLAEMARELRPRLPFAPILPACRNCATGWQGQRPCGGRGPEAIAEAADRPADWVMSAIVGAAGLVPGLRALVHGATWRWRTRKAW
jgi:1-deoxy-D-xylulose-5-phosphate reductoisomerase